MKSLVLLALAAACFAPAAFGGPPAATLKAKLEERYGNYATGVWEGSKIKKGGETTITLTIDPTKIAYIAGACDGCYMFGLIAKDEAGKDIASRYSDSAKPEFFIPPNTVPAGKIKLTIDTASGCEKPQCEYAVGVYYPGPRQ